MVNDSNRGLRLAVAVVVLLGGLAGCATTTGGTAAVGTDATPRSVATTTERTTETTRPTKPTRTTPPSTTSSSPTATARPTDAAGAPAPASAGLLLIGDCYTVTGGEAAGVDCTDLHDGQVVASGVALPDIDPAEASAGVWAQAASGTCADDFDIFLGSLTDGYAQSYVITSPIGGPPVIACTVVDAAGEQWIGSAENASGSYEGIDVGDCFDYPTTLADALEIPCDQPHDAEMFVVDAGLGLDAPETPYPPDDQWQTLSETACLGPFADYTGQSYESALDLEYSFVYPLEADWSDVSLRTMSCAIASADGSKLTGTRRA